MVLYGLKPRFQALLKPLADALVRRKVHPTTINLLAVVLAVVVGACFARADTTPALLALVPLLLFARIALNALDGMVARQARTPFAAWGEYLNEACDRVSDAAMLLGLLFYTGVDARLVALAVASVLLVSYLGILPKAAGGAREYRGLLTKADRAFVLGVLALVLLLLTPLSAPVTIDAALIIITVTSAFTVAQRIAWARGALRR